MDVNTIRASYLKYFRERDHAEIPSAPLVPENDPTTLFTGSGMQPLLPYLLGADHPKGTRLVDSQKCFRSGDIDEVGDNRHTTFFEMLGNWSLGEYGKEEQLRWFFSFLVDEVGIPSEKLVVTAFAGDEKFGIPRDTESAEIWQKLFQEKGVSAQTADMGSEEAGAERGMHEDERIFYFDAAKNWWSRSGVPVNMPEGEPGGPDSEVFFDFGTEHDTSYGTHCHPNCDCGRFLEIGNSVFMQYKKEEDGSFSKLPKQNVDFGGGLERIAAVAKETPDIFEVSPLSDLVSALPTTLKYGEIDREATGEFVSGKSAQKAFRIVADHVRAAVFLIADGVVPSNTDQGYVLRRLLRRAVLYAQKLKTGDSYLTDLVDVVVGYYTEPYPVLLEKRAQIGEVMIKEELLFNAALARGLREFEKLSGSTVSGHDAFVLFSTYGFPLEMTVELAEEKGMTVETEAFESEMAEHQNLSRAGSEQKFKGGLADASDKTTALHTCTHLMLAGLRKYLGPDVHQAGSNITEERTRFDFTHPEKVSRDILDKVEAYVNEAIEKGCPVITTVKNKEDAKAEGVEGSFWEKYPDEVTVYEVKAEDGTVYSQELCGGPHVENTSDIKGIFKIKKEQASSAGVRRIKAVLTSE